MGEYDKVSLLPQIRKIFVPNTTTFAWHHRRGRRVHDTAHHQTLFLARHHGLGVRFMMSSNTSSSAIGLHNRKQRIWHVIRNYSMKRKKQKLFNSIRSF